jgi:hypothetical protein
VQLRAPSSDEARTAGAWFERDRLPGFGALVGRMAPTGFEAYARVLHPAAEEDGTPVRWSQVAARTGRTIHPLVQWHRLVAAEDSFGRGGLWPGQAPGFALEDEQVDVLVELLAPHTTTPDHVWFAWGQHMSESSAVFPRVLLGRDEYLLGAGPLTAAQSFGARREAVTYEAPGVWWPQDRAWCVGSDADIDSSVVGGSAALVDLVLTDPRLEALPVGPSDSLMHDADLVN